MPAHSVTVISGKGGVGKTTFSTNLALNLARKGKKVLLIDGDFSLGKVHIALGMKVRFTFHHFMTEEKSLQDVLLEAPFGLLVLPAASGIASLSNLSHVKRDRLVREIKRRFSDLDYIIVDAPAGIPKQAIGFALATDETICVCNPEFMSLSDSYAVYKLLLSLQPKISFRFLMNRVEGKREYLEQMYRLFSTVRSQLRREVETIGYLPEYHNFKVENIIKNFKNHAGDEAYYKKLEEMTAYFLKNDALIQTKKERSQKRTLLKSTVFTPPVSS